MKAQIIDKSDIDGNIFQTHFQLLIVQVCFSMLPVLAKIAFRSFSSPAVMFFRVIGTAACLGCFFFIFRFEKIKNLGHYLYFALLAFLGVVGNQYLFLKGLSLTQAANASLLIATIPIFTLMIAGISRMEKLTLQKSAGVLVAFIGIGLLLNFTRFRLTGYEIGSLMIITNSLLYSIFLVISKPILRQYQPFTVITYVFLFGTIEALPLSIQDLRAISFSTINGQAYLFLSLVIVIGTILPYSINTRVLGSNRSTLVAIYTYLQPLLGTLLAVIFLNEALSARFFLATLLIFCGIFLVSLEKLRRKKPEASI